MSSVTRIDPAELHIYGGVALTSLGALLAVGLAFALAVLGFGLVTVGLLMALAPPPPPPERRLTTSMAPLTDAGDTE